MNIILIWDGFEIDQKRLECIRSIWKYKFDNDKVVLVSNANFIGKDVIWLNIECIKNDIKMQFDKITSRLDSINICLRSDVIRCYLAGNIDNMLYVDTDIKFTKKIPRLENVKKPYFAKYGRKRVDQYMFYNGGCLDFFRGYMNELNKIFDEMLPHYGAMFRSLNVWVKRSGGCQILQDDFYEHLAFRGRNNA